MWPKFGNPSVSMRDIIKTSILYRLDKKKNFLEGCSSFKFNSLGLSLGVALKLYTIVARVKNEDNFYICRS